MNVDHNVAQTWLTNVSQMTWGGIRLIGESPLKRGALYPRVSHIPRAALRGQA